MTVLDSQTDVRTARLHLRPLRESDCEQLYELFVNWEVMRWLSSPPWPYSRDDARDFIAARKLPDPDFITAAIVLDDIFIGSIGAIMKPASAVQPQRGYNIGYWIGQPYWGLGYMSEVARAFVAHVFATIPDDTIYSGAFVDNAASLRIQEKLGFQPVSNAALFSNSNRKEMPHIGTVLTRERFAALNS